MSLSTLYYTGKSYCKGSLSTIDHLVLTSVEQLHFLLKMLLTFLQNKQP
jgi:hypothetical protein